MTIGGTIGGGIGGGRGGRAVGGGSSAAAEPYIVYVATELWSRITDLRRRS